MGLDHTRHERASPLRPLAHPTRSSVAPCAQSKNKLKGTIPNEFFDELREHSDKGTTPLPNGNPLPKELFKFSQEEVNSTTADIMSKLLPENVKRQGETQH